MNNTVSKPINLSSLHNQVDAELVFVFTVTGKPDKEVDLEQYFKAKGTLHCTTKYCNYGKAKGAKEYLQKPVRPVNKLFVYENCKPHIQIISWQFSSCTVM